MANVRNWFHRRWEGIQNHAAFAIVCAIGTTVVAIGATVVHFILTRSERLTPSAIFAGSVFVFFVVLIGGLWAAARFVVLQKEWAARRQLATNPSPLAHVAVVGPTPEEVQRRDDELLRIETLYGSLYRCQEGLEGLQSVLKNNSPEDGLEEFEQQAAGFIDPARASIDLDGEASLGKARVAIFDGGHPDAVFTRPAGWSYRRFEVFRTIETHALHLADMCGRLADRERALTKTRK
jgi:hypothetical protein